MCPGVYSISQSCLNTEFLSLYFFMEHIVELVFYGVCSGKHCSKQINLDPDLADRVPRIFHCHILLCLGQECHSAMTPWSIHTPRLPVQDFSIIYCHLPHQSLSLSFRTLRTLCICSIKWWLSEAVQGNERFQRTVLSGSLRGYHFGHENIIQLNSFGQETFELYHIIC